MQKNYSDIVYSCKYGNDENVKIALIIEHKSYVPNVNIKFQLLNYFSEAISTQLKQGIKTPSITIMILFYHGKTKWKTKPLRSIFGKNVPKELYEYIPEFKIVTVDISKFDNAKMENLFDSLKLRATLFILLDITNDLKFIKTFKMVLDKVIAPLSPIEMRETAVSILNYIGAFSKKNQQAKKVINTKKGENKMNFFEKILLEREKIGIAKGLKIGEESGVLKDK